MNYVLFVYFSIGACIPQCDFSQIGQLDDLLEHYDLHQDEALKLGSEISFAEFLYIHFIEGDEHHHPNDSEHHNLPLNSISCEMILFFKQAGDISKSFFTLIQKRGIAFNLSFYLNPFVNQIFHPPIVLH